MTQIPPPPKPSSNQVPMSAAISEDSGCALQVVGFVTALVVVIAIVSFVNYQINKRDNWILDLQRRIATLEQQCK